MKAWPMIFAIVAGLALSATTVFVLAAPLDTGMDPGRSVVTIPAPAACGGVP
jgi:hypothetical protein